MPLCGDCQGIGTWLYEVLTLKSNDFEYKHLDDVRDLLFTCLRCEFCAILLKALNERNERVFGRDAITPFEDILRAWPDPKHEDKSFHSESRSTSIHLRFRNDFEFTPFPLQSPKNARYLQTFMAIAPIRAQRDGAMCDTIISLVIDFQLSEHRSTVRVLQDVAMSPS